MHVARIILSHSRLAAPPTVIALSESELGRELHHLQRVLRLRVGDALEILDLESPNLLRCEIAGLDESELRLSIIELVERPAPPIIRVAFGLTAFPALETAVEKLTELEISEIGIFFADRSQRLEILEKKLERLEKIRDAARIQSGSRAHTRMTVFESLPETLLHFSTAQHRFLMSLSKGAVNLFDYLNKSKDLETLRNSADVSLIVGPEGGLKDEEESQALGDGFVAVSLGKSTLRAETAATSAVSLIRLAFER